MKNTNIFADRYKDDQSIKTQPSDIPSPDVYKEAIKEAYKEGLQDARKEDSSKEAPKPQTSFDQKTKKEKEGTAEGAKNHARDMEESKRKLEAIADRHDVQIMRAKTVFPFTMFPDTIIIDTTKVTIIKKQMFATEQVITIPLKDLSDANIQTALFLASLTVKYLPHSNNPGMLEPVKVEINCLKREDAIRAKNILKGILIASSEDIDLAKLPPEEMVSIIEKFGTSDDVT